MLILQKKEHTKKTYVLETLPFFQLSADIITIIRRIN